MRIDPLIAEQGRRWLASRLSAECTSSPSELACTPGQLCALSESEGVAALLSHALSSLDRCPVEEEVFAQLHARELSRAALDLRREQEVLRLLGLLESSGITVLLLGGEALAAAVKKARNLRYQAAAKEAGA